ncbi:MAG: hypothetical protein RIS70_3565 [Planctomycetota bacterium]
MRGCVAPRFALAARSAIDKGPSVTEFAMIKPAEFEKFGSPRCSKPT